MSRLNCIFHTERTVDMNSLKSKEAFDVALISDLRGVPLAELPRNTEAAAIVTRLISDIGKTSRIPVAAFNSFI